MNRASSGDYGLAWDGYTCIGESNQQKRGKKR